MAPDLSKFSIPQDRHAGQSWNRTHAINPGHGRHGGFRLTRVIRPALTGLPLPMLLSQTKTGHLQSSCRLCNLRCRDQQLCGVVNLGGDNYKREWCAKINTGWIQTTPTALTRVVFRRLSRSFIGTRPFLLAFASPFLLLGMSFCGPLFPTVGEARTYDALSRSNQESHTQSAPKSRNTTSHHTAHCSR